MDTVNKSNNGSDRLSQKNRFIPVLEKSRNEVKKSAALIMLLGSGNNKENIN